MKQNVTVSIDKGLLQKARILASQRGTSISAMVADELKRLIGEEASYEQAKARAIARLSAPFELGGRKPTNREALHDRRP